MKTYTIASAIEDVASNLGDDSPTTIRCALNDALDHASKSGFRVRFDYNQPRAVKAVQKIVRFLGQLEEIGL